jgi:hypothetical protein
MKRKISQWILDTAYAALLASLAALVACNGNHVVFWTTMLIFFAIFKAWMPTAPKRKKRTE